MQLNKKILVDNTGVALDYLSKYKLVTVFLLLLIRSLSLFAAPIISTTSPISINESSVDKFVVKFIASGTGTITYGLNSGADTSNFIIDPSTGNLYFKYFPDYEKPGGRNITLTSASTVNTYLITVKATDDNGTTTKSFTINVNNVDENPDPPRNLFVVSQDQSNILYWTASVVTTGITEYRIYRSEDSITWNYRDAVPIGTTTYTDINLINGKFYFYTIRAWNGSIESVNSTVDASTPDKPEISSYLHFDGINDFLVASDSAKLMGAHWQEGTTMECWVRFNTLPSGKTYILSRDYNLPNVATPSNGSTIVRWYSIYYDPNGGGVGEGRIIFEYNVQGSSSHQRKIISNTKPVVNTWYHVAGTFSYSSTPIWYPVRLYINGHLEKYLDGTNGNVFENINSTTYPAESRFVIGATTTALSPFTYGNFFDGDISEVRYWTKDWDSTTIQANMFSRLRGDEANLIGLWHLDTLFNNQTYDYDNLNFNAIKHGDVCSASPQTIAVDNLIAVQASTTTYIDVKKNDIFSSPGKTVRTKIISGPLHGSASVLNFDSISYNPGCFLGIDTIRYVICDTTFFRNPYNYSDTAFVIITVNDNPPVITSNGGGVNVSLTINENSTTLTTVTATDMDICHTKTYSISGGADQTKFTINSSSGILTFITASDFDIPTDAGFDNVYDVQVAVSDGTLADLQDIAVTVANVNEAPVITSDGGGTSASKNINENNTTLTKILVVDPDVSTTLTYSIAGGDDAAKFAIDGSSGDLTFVSAPDFENPTDFDGNNIYEVRVRVYDNGIPTAPTPVLDDIQDISVSVQNVNDNNPIIAATVKTIAENTTVIETVTATDADAGDTQIFSISGTDFALFDINSTTGVLTFILAPNYESPGDAGGNNVYDLTVTVTDAAGHTDSGPITVTITDVIEVSALSIDAIANATVAENSAYTSVTPALTGTPIGTVTCTLGGTDAADFTIDASTGVVSMVARNFESPVDDNTDNIYELTLTVTDADGNDDTEDWTVTVTDVIEFSAITVNAITDATVSENAVYTSVTPVLAGIPVGTVTYTLGGTDAADFTIDASTGVVSMVARNFESPADDNTDNVYELTLTVTDADGNNDTEDWTVTVTDVIEFSAITVNAIADVTVAENAVYTSVTPVFTGIPIGTVTYTLGGTDAADFTIDAATGVVSMVARDFESPADDNTDNVYELTLTVTDADGNNDTEDWTVTVTNVNETPEITSDGGGAIASVNSDENVSIVTTVVATDIDAATTFSYNITGGADQALFVINGSTGILSFINAPNFEIPADAGLNDVYDVQVTVSDGLLTDVQDIAVTVINMNDAPTDIILSKSVIDESKPLGTGLGRFFTTDEDISDIHSYSISGTDAASFAIDGDSLRTNAVFNYSIKSSYEIIVTTNDGNLTYSKSFNILINKVNSPPSGIILSNTLTDENQPAGTIIGTLGVTDPDLTDTHAFTISGADASFFIIDGNQLKNSILFNYEARVNYNISITATDNYGASYSEAFIITVNNVNETPIDILLSNNAITEEQPVGTNIGILSSSDEDAGDTHTYSILAGSDAAYFTISGDILKAAAIFDFSIKPDYNITLRATDQGGLYFDKAFTITINNVNGAPQILDFSNNAVDTINIDAFENETTQVCLNVSDPDNNNTAISVLHSRNGSGTLLLDSNNPVCFNYTPPDNFIGGEILFVRVCDDGLPSLCDSVIIIMHVIPRFIFSQVISPNGDGINETWTIGGLERFPDNNVIVFSRWGDIVYKSRGYDNVNVFWNGDYNTGNSSNKNVPNGTYFYLIELGNGSKLTGFIVLNR